MAISGGQNMTVGISANLDVSNVLGGVKAIQGAFNGLKINPNLTGEITKEFGTLQNLLKDYQKSLEKGVTSKSDIKNLEKLEKAINSSFSKVLDLQKQFEGKTLVSKVDSSQLDELRKKTEEARVALNNAFSNIKIGSSTDGLAKIEGDIEKAVARSKTLKESFGEVFDSLKAGSIDQFGRKLDSTFDNLANKLKSGKLTTTADNLLNTFKQLGLVNIDVKTSTAEERITALKAGFNALKQGIATGLNGDELKGLVTNLENAAKAEKEFEAAAQKRGRDSFQKQAQDAAVLAERVREGTQAEREFQQATLSATQQVEQLQQSTQYFFSLRNMINLLKRGIREAVGVVKELDAAMTQTAVVTNFSVGDMWAKLPEYTANANALGATVKDMYEATTLYYQQGLNTQQAMSIATETMKMARIGGLEAADATDKMTAALRGFNMEINEASAKRINDVYSNLAAKTASNTEELGTAMQRTASIAASAGMSFEGTAAFLAQAIETTREPAENLGTAMKTIVARFTELKKNPLEITEVDGEEVDYNKVDTALKSIGVSLKDTNGQFRDLDQVFLDISERWNSLSQTQQRYIATTAAGSRQQSRFIAMMSNYERTMQLMDYANNSAGASNEQFGKTMESLEAKLNKFKNAWNQFLMSIMNDSWTKGIVDGATKVLNVINDLIDKLSFGSKGIKSVLSLFAAFTGLKLAGRGVNALIGGLGGLVDPKTGFGKGFKTGALGGRQNEINQATNRIVQAIHSLVPHIDGKASATSGLYKFQDPGNYNQARKELVNSLGGHLGQIRSGQGTYTIGSLLDIIDSNKLNLQQQKQFFQASPGLKKNLTKSLTRLYQDIGTDKKTTQALVSGFKKGDLGLEEALMGNKNLTTSFEKAYTEIANKSGWAAARAFHNEHYQPLYNEAIEKGMSEAEANAYANESLKNKTVLNQKGRDFLQNPQTLTNSQKFANLAGQIGAGFMAAGSAVQMFGAQVAQINPIIGQAISNIGGLLTTVGGLANAIPAIIAGGPVAWGIAAAVLTIGGVVAGLKAHTENIKKQGQEIVDTYNDVSNELKDSISSIKGYQDELGRLSAGVDKNGFNINLDDTEYQRYQELVDDLIQQNPSVVEGWNSEGKAIINVNKALKDTIQLKQQELDSETEKYLSDVSGQKIINARNVTKGYKQAGKLQTTGNTIANLIEGSGLADEAKAAGFDLDKLRQGDLQAINFLRSHYNLLESVYKQGGKEIDDTLSEQLGNLDDNVAAYEEAISPVVDYLMAYAKSEKLFADLPAELTGAFNEGLKSIAGKDLSVGEMKKAANYLGLELRSAFDKAEPFLNKADEALDKFAQDLDETAYNNTAAEIAQELRDLAAEARALNQVEIAEWYENQASRVENAISNSVESIGNYINTLADDIANAKANFSALGEGIDDYYSLADQAYGLVETALESKNTEGKGSKTFWNTYRGLASEDAYNEHDIDKAIANMKQFQKYFTEGAEGSRAFAQKMIAWQDKEFKFTDNNGKTVTKRLSDFFELAEDGTMRVTDAFTNLNDEQYAQLASIFDLSADGFTAVLNKLRQFGDLNFNDPKGIRKALALDERTIKTDVKVEVEGEEDGVNRLYYGQSMLEAEMSDLEPDEQKDIVHDLEVQGSIQLPSGAENLIQADIGGGQGSLLKQFVEDTKGKGNQVENVLKALVQTGEYNKEDLEKIHAEITSDGGLLAGAADAGVGFEDLYDGIIKDLENPAMEQTNDHLGHISSTVDTIAGIIAAGKVKEGFLPDVAKQSGALYNELVGEKGKVDTWAQLFSKGKDEKGNLITDEATYNAYYDTLTEYKEQNDKYIATLKEGRQAAVDRGASVAEIEAFDEEIESAEHNAELIDQYLTDGAAAWETTSSDLEAAANSITTAQTRIGELTTGEVSPGSDLSVLQSIITDAFAIIRDSNLSAAEKQQGAADILASTAAKLESSGWEPKDIQGFFKENFDIELELNENGEFASDIGAQIQNQLSNLGEAEIDAILNIQSISVPGAAKGKNNTPSAIRRVGTMARGSKRGYIVDGEPTLTGELGPELVWEPKQNAAYMVGEHGPQFASLSKNAVVWNAQQTKKIRKNSKSTSRLGTGAYGIHSFGTMAGGNAGGGGLKVPGLLEVDANANIQDIVPPAEMPTIPVKATFDDNNSTDSIEATATVTKVVKDGLVSGEPISVQATATTTKVKNETPNPQVSTGTQTINVTANTSAAQAKINQLIQLFNKTYTLKYQASGPSSISVPISANFTGSWKKTVEITKSGARGINNNIRNHFMPSFGSLARGRYGTIGPNNKGGLTLTGEKGFEIAWLPSENRSMVLGTDGPQMLQLPSDAVVYTHEQSKKILKQKAIPAGSHANTASGNNIFAYLNTGSGGGGGGVAKTVKDTANTVAKAATDTAKQLGYVSVWWENIARKTEASQRKMDENQKTFEKYLKKIRATLKTTGWSLDSGGGSGDAYIKSISTTMGYYQAQLDKADKELSTLNAGTSAQQKAKTDKQKKKANEAAYNSGAASAVQISYKSGKKSKEEIVNLAPYIRYENGAYVVDQSQINKIKNKDKRKAVADAANKEINDRVSKKNKADDEIKKAQEALEKFSEELYKTFFAWETELTQIWNITQKIEEAQKRISNIDAFGDLLEAQIGSGRKEANSESAQTGIENFKRRIEEQQKVLEQRREAITQSQKDLKNALSTNDEKTTLQAIKDKLSADAIYDRKKAQVDAAENAKKAYKNAVTDKKNQEQTKANVQKKIDKLEKKKKKTKKEKAELKKLKEQRKALNDKIKKDNDIINQNKNIAAQLPTLQSELDALSGNLNETQRTGYEQYKKELEDRIKVIETAQSFGKVTHRGDGTIDIEFDTEKLESEKLGGNITEEMAKAIEEYWKDAVELRDKLLESYEELTKSVTEFYTSLKDLKDQAADYSEKLLNISDQAEKKKIDNLKKLSSSLKSAVDNLFKEVKNKLDNRRKQENNAKTERDISQKQQRLAALRADTSGGHQVEIAQLEKEIADAQQDYQRSLEDQLIDKLQQQADLAAEQRERQIELQEALVTSVNNIALINAWMADPEAEGVKEAMREAYYEANNYNKSTAATQDKIARDFESLYQGILTNKDEQELVTDAINSLEAKINETETILDQINKALTAEVIEEEPSVVEQIEEAQEDKEITLNEAKANNMSLADARSKFTTATFKDFKDIGEYSAQEFKQANISYADAKGAGFTLDQLKAAGYTEAQTEIDKNAALSAYQKFLSNRGSKKKSGDKNWGKIGKDGLAAQMARAKTLGYTETKVLQDLANTDALGWSKVLKAYIKYKGTKAKAAKVVIPYFSTNKSNARLKGWKSAFGKAYPKYETGGLADYTGPAWLDGTPSKPELILNAKDTQNFIALKDVLSKAIGSTNSINNTYGGDNIFEININVDKIEKDYDVDRVADRVKKKILESSSYRNVTQVRNFR